MTMLPLTDELHDPRVDESNRPVWRASFSSTVRLALVDEDLEAGRGVSAILVTIVSAGLLLGLVGVVAAIATL